MIQVVFTCGCNRSDFGLLSPNIATMRVQQKRLFCPECGKQCRTQMVSKMIEELNTTGTIKDLEYKLI